MFANDKVHGCCDCHNVTCDFGGMSLLFGSTKPHLVSVHHSEDANSTDEIHIDPKLWSVIVSPGNFSAEGRITVTLEPVLLAGLQLDSSGIRSIISWARLDSQVSWFEHQCLHSLFTAKY